MSHELNFPLDQFLFSQAQIARIARVQRTAINRRVHTLMNDMGDGFCDKKTRKFNVTQTRKVLSSYFLDEKRKIKNKINMFYNFKGGTGKTTLCYQLSTTLSFMGFNVLTIDCDPQGHLTSMFGLPEDHKLPTVYDIMINGYDLEKSLIHVYEGLDLIPSSILVTKIELPLSQKVYREETLTRILTPVSKKYDFIMIDANPAFSLLNLNVLLASSQLNVICETQPFSLSGLTQMIEEIESVYGQMKRKLNYSIIPNKFESKTAAAQEVLGALRKDYRKETTQTVIRKCEDINISSKKRLPTLCFADKNSIATEDILDLSHEFLDLSLEVKRQDFNAVA